jgi:hypothetical protein
MKIQHEQRHRNGKDPIAQGGKAFQILARDTVVMHCHWLSPRSQFNSVRSS